MIIRVYTPHASIPLSPSTFFVLGPACHPCQAGTCCTRGMHVIMRGGILLLIAPQPGMHDHQGPPMSMGYSFLWTYDQHAMLIRDPNSLVYWYNQGASCTWPISTPVITPGVNEWTFVCSMHALHRGFALGVCITGLLRPSKANTLWPCYLVSSCPAPDMRQSGPIGSQWHRLIPPCSFCSE